MNWTEEQRSVIETRDKTILVAAGAGSGKTAVLVERIFSLLTDPNHPTDIDRLLIVTFTKAAASEMKSRILARVKDAVKEGPENVHLSRQTQLIHNALITTIDGFCSFVLRSYGNTIALDGGFRIGEEGEMLLLKKDVLRSVFENAHAEGDAGFLSFVEAFAPGKREEPLMDLVLSVYETAAASPSPQDFFEMCESTLSDTTFMEVLLQDAKRQLVEIAVLAEGNRVLAASPGGPSAYLPLAEAEAKALSAIAEAPASYESMRAALLSYEKGRLSTKKPLPGEDPALREQFKETRADYQDLLKTLKEDYFAYPFPDVLRLDAMSAGPLTALLALTRSFSEAYAAAKRKRNLVDFTDLEQLALRILTDEAGNPTEAAGELSRRFDFVMIDEYQDSNYLQEALLTAVSRLGRGEPNYFMVGDVKQSIYSFRQARPSLFMKKYDRFPTEADSLRIDLHTNFRSRAEVLSSVNALFRRIMQRAVGGIDYDDAAALLPGAPSPALPENVPGSFTPELLLLVSKDEAETEEDSLSRTERRAMEARVVGERILSMVGKESLYDADTGTFRPVTFRDIVVLLRATTGWGDLFRRTFESMGIPVYVSEKTGYFSAEEVETILSYLTILDNPRQDIPLAAVLRSPIGELSDAYLAEIRIFGNAYNAEAANRVDAEGTSEGAATTYYDCVTRYAENGPDPALREKLSAFLADLTRFREDALLLPVHVLLSKILEETGYYTYCSAQPGGQSKIANLEMLIEKATQYEGTSYTGLFHFVRYIRTLRSYSVDYGEALAVSDTDDVVRIMTIHHSKGLEFPVVFLPGLRKSFNKTDLNASVLVHPDLGVASDAIDPENRTKAKTLRKLFLRKQLAGDFVGEELRVLYVAMTRAKQKLILSGSLRSEKALAAIEKAALTVGNPYPERLLRGAQDLLSILLPAVLADPQHCGFAVRTFYPADLLTSETVRLQKSETLLRSLFSVEENALYDAAYRALLTERFQFRYPYEGESDIPGKVSVSELKAAHYYDADAFQTYETPPVIPLIPDFMKESEETLSPADRGNACHHAMELLNFAAFDDTLRSIPFGTASADEIHSFVDSAFVNVTEEFSPDVGRTAVQGSASLLQELTEMVRSQLAALTDGGRLRPEEALLIQPSDIAAFLASPLGRRVVRAAKEGILKREQTFTYAAPASSIDPSFPSSETILVQGVIDAYFQESGHLILLDYKTDNVSGPYAASTLKKRYAVQIESYADALSRLTGLPVAERYIYSFTLGAAIPL